MYSDKPKIVPTAPLSANGWDYSKGKWLCHNDYFITAQGDTPEEAYNLWCSKMLAISYVPRRGIWNIRDVLDWFARGCPVHRSYLGRKRFIGYIPETDELVLQGY